MTARRLSRRQGEPRVDARGSAGFSLVESVVVVALVGVSLAVAVPVLGRIADVADAAAAARYLAGRIGLARLDAARGQRTLALRIGRTPPFPLDLVADGDGDGVSAADLADGTDPVVEAADPLAVHFPRARLAVARDVTGLDGGPALREGDDPLRLGAADQISVSPSGTSTSGTIYVASQSGAQFAVRVAGATGRARVFRFDPGAGTWRPY